MARFIHYIFPLPDCGVFKLTGREAAKGTAEQGETLSES